MILSGTINTKRRLVNVNLSPDTFLLRDVICYPDTRLSGHSAPGASVGHSFVTGVFQCLLCKVIALRIHRGKLRSGLQWLKFHGGHLSIHNACALNQGVAWALSEDGIGE
jgi:hypothetical protein